MKLDEKGYNEFGCAMCECGNKRIHAWEPGERCSPERVVPAAAPTQSESAALADQPSESAVKEGKRTDG